MKDFHSMNHNTEGSVGAGQPQARYGEYTDADREELVVEIKAADYNGRSWDGSPFSATPTWLGEALFDRKLVPHTRGSTDYAEWDVKTAAGMVSASPGDLLIRRKNGDLSVVDTQDAFIILNLFAPVAGISDLLKR